jgi:hypothetical protein
MEKKTIIPSKEFDQGFYMQLECCICNTIEFFGAETKDQLKDIVKAHGWRNLSSDKSDRVGYYCGCKY